MKIILASFLMMFALMVTSASSVKAQYTVNLNGRVTRSEDGAGIFRANVHIVSLNTSQTYSVLTDYYGYYNVDVDYDKYFVYVTIHKNNITFSPNVRFVETYDFDNIDFVGTPNY